MHLLYTDSSTESLHNNNSTLLYISRCAHLHLLYTDSMLLSWSPHSIAVHQQQNNVVQQRMCSFAPVVHRQHVVVMVSPHCMRPWAQAAKQGQDLYLAEQHAGILLCRGPLLLYKVTLEAVSSPLPPSPGGAANPAPGFDKTTGMQECRVVELALQ